MTTIRRYGLSLCVAALLLGSAFAGSAIASGDATPRTIARHKSTQHRAKATQENKDALDPTLYEPECIHACQDEQRACMLVCAKVNDDADHKECVEQCIR